MAQRRPSRLAEHVTPAETSGAAHGLALRSDDGHGGMPAATAAAAGRRPFATTLSDFRLTASPTTAASPINIPASPSLARPAPDPSSEHPNPFVRRAAAAAAGTRSGGRLRRSSMLGNEVIAPAHERTADASPSPPRAAVSAAPVWPSAADADMSDAAPDGDDRPGSSVLGAAGRASHSAQVRAGASSPSPALTAFHRRRMPQALAAHRPSRGTRTPNSAGSSSSFSSARSASEGVEAPPVPESAARGAASAWNEAPLVPTVGDMDGIAGSRVWEDGGDEDMASGSDSKSPQTASSPGGRWSRGATVPPRTPPPHAADEADTAERAERDTARFGTSASSVGGSTPGGSATRTGVVRRAVHRRANLLPKDRSIARVIATLQDESRPTDSELASEAKLARRLGGEDSPLPPNPRFARATSPFVAFGGGSPGLGFGWRAGSAWSRHEDDSALEGVGFGSGDNSCPSSDDEAMSSSARRRAVESDEEVMSDGNRSARSSGLAMAGDTSSPAPGSMAAPPLSSSASARRGTLWMGFRDGRTRASPGADRFLRQRTPGSSSMDIEIANAGAGGSPGLWGRSAKRKMGAEERYDPYASSAYKRRAVSPATLLTSGPGLVSPSLVASAAGSGSLPVPTPLSIPSPTISFSAAMSSAAASRGGGPSYFTHARQPGSGARGHSRSGSPATRPSTPTGGPAPGFAGFGGAGPSPSLLSTSAGSAAQASGSGPGYGSGALGLSIGGNSAVASGKVRLYRDEEDGEEMDEGVNAMTLDPD